MNVHEKGQRKSNLKMEIQDATRWVKLTVLQKEIHKPHKKKNNRAEPTISKSNERKQNKKVIFDRVNSPMRSDGHAVVPV